MTRVDFILYAIGFMAVGGVPCFFAGLAAGSTFMLVRISESVRTIDDSELGREESLCR